MLNCLDSLRTYEYERIKKKNHEASCHIHLQQTGKGQMPGLPKPVPQASHAESSLTEPKQNQTSSLSNCLRVK